MSVAPEFQVNLTEFSENKVKSRVSEKNSVRYQVLNYDLCCDNDTNLGLYRSVVIEPETKKILSYGPPKSVTLDFFKEVHPNIKGDRYQINETIEGTMVNLFYDDRVNSWEISTKGAISGEYWFYRTVYDACGNMVTSSEEKQLTFRTMFLHSLGYSEGSELNDVELFKELPKDHIYSFVMQHPENHIVMQIEFAKLYLVSVFFKKDSDVLQWVPLNAVQNWSSLSSLAHPIHFPHELKGDEKAYDVLEGYVQNPYDFRMGVMIADVETGMRTSIINPEYERLKEIRGNNPNLQYHYYSLEHADKKNEFLKHFPRYKKKFGAFQRQTADFIRGIHDAYVMYHVQKRGKEVRIPKYIFNHVYKLHYDVYLPSLQRGERVIVTKNVVADYFNNMQPKEKLYYVNMTEVA